VVGVNDGAAREEARPDEDSSPVLDIEGRELSTFDLKVYRRAGLDRAEAGQWAQSGVRPYQAEGFRQAGLGLEAAARLTRLGMSGSFAARAVAQGLDPEEAWRQAEDDRRRQQEADDARAAADADEAERQRTQRELALADFLTFADDDLITISDIADMLKADRAVVSRWASDDRFPGPEVPGRSPLFSARKVIEYFSKPSSARSAAFDPSTLSVEWAWGIYSRRALDPDGSANPRELAAAIVTVAAERLGSGAPRLSELCDASSSDPLGTPTERVALALQPLRDVAGYGELVDELSSVAPRVAAAPPIFVRRLDLALDIGLSPSFLLDSLLDAQSGEGRGRRRNSTNHALADLIVHLAAPRRGERVHDPACGEGELLLWCAQAMGRTASVSLSGRDLDTGAARIARCRLYLRHIAAQIEAGDSFDHPGAVGPLVIADPEIGSSRKQISAWLALATGHRGTPVAGNERRAVLALPKAAVPTGSASTSPLDDYREVLRAVVLLPARIKPGSREFIAVVLLGAEADPDRNIVVLDLRSSELSSSDRLQSPSRHVGPKSSSTRLESRRDWLGIPAVLDRALADPAATHRLPPTMAVCAYGDLGGIVDNPLPARSDLGSVVPNGPSVAELTTSLLGALERTGQKAVANEIREVLLRNGLPG